MNSIRRIVVAALVLAAWSAGQSGVESVAAQSRPAHLEAVLHQMDVASAGFKSAQADVRQEIFTKIVADTDTKSGSIYFKRAGGATEMGMKMPDQIVAFKGGTLRVFDVAANHVNEFSTAGKNQALAETFLTLGFGGSGRDLDKQWTIEDKGQEQMSDGKQTVAVEQLDLVSKDPAVRKQLAHATIWVDPARGVSLKQVLTFSPSGDTRTAVYTNIRMNQPVDEGPFAIKCKGKCS